MKIQETTFRYSAALDQLRFIAAFLVFLSHFGGVIEVDYSASWLHLVPQLWFKWGAIGVAFFLVLSAFLFTMNCDLGARQINYVNFMKKRLLRIGPMYVLVCLLLLTQNRAEWSVLDLLRFVTFQVNTGNPMTGFGHELLPIGPIWTIAVEFQFYMIFPLLILAFPPDNVIRIIGFILCIIIFRVLLSMWTLGGDAYFNSYHTLIGRIDQFMIGIIAAVYYKKSFHKVKPLAAWGLLLVWFLIATAYLYYFRQEIMPFNMISFTIEGVLGAALVLLFQSSKGFGLGIGKILEWLGSASYSFYLLHLPVGAIMLRYYGISGGLWSNNIWNIVLYAFLPSILISLLTYQFIEKPFINIGRRGPISLERLP